MASACRGDSGVLNLGSDVNGAKTKRIWRDLYLHISSFNAVAVTRCVPEGRLESRPAIYRRYWVLELLSSRRDDRNFVAEAIQFNKSYPWLRHGRRCSSVPPGRWTIPRSHYLRAILATA